MSTNLRISAAVVVGFALVIAAMVLLSGASNRGQAADAGAGPAQVVHDDSHRLSTAAEGAPVFVEFLDFECESCRAAFPAVEQLREEYGDRVTFVVRYFPIPSHANAENAAVAVEAAAQQGQLEAMYRRMFETQTEWGEQRESKADVFRGFAQDLGLDMDAYDRAVADPATLERVRRDRDDGAALGVEGTPTFFLDGERIQPSSLDDLRAQFDAALGA